MTSQTPPVRRSTAEFPAEHDDCKANPDTVCLETIAQVTRLESLPSLNESFEQQLHRAWQQAYAQLAAEQLDGHWIGELSTSALSTATAVSALVQMQLASGQHASDPQLRQRIGESIAGGCDWLARHQNDDGGFGDTNRSHSNIATTYLVLAAWEMAGFARSTESQTSQAWDYVQRQGAWTGLRERYGQDKTFVVPILSNCALAGLVAWREVPALPFEAAWLPQDWYRLARMPVVSYAVPALVAIGQARFHFAPTKWPWMRALRSRAAAPTLEVLRRMQPASGGYLEAVPLTSFVLMNLAAIGKQELPVAQDCLRFLLESRLDDGSWPIDTNLATWVTSLSINALARAPRGCEAGGPGRSNQASAKDETTAGPTLVRRETIEWLLSCQHLERHPFTGANPGGWGWTDLSGAVPDADDTPAALLALRTIDWDQAEWRSLEPQALAAVGRGIGWLYRLQNRDGGWPTFCRGWGKLPFDRSGTDLTAHALRALSAWLPDWERCRGGQRSALPAASQLRAAMERGLKFLDRQQTSDGSWLPLWFGNQDRREEDNPVYGTGRVLQAFADLGLTGHPACQNGLAYLRACQNADGGWGGGPSTSYRVAPPRDGPSVGKLTGSQVFSTIEETSVALDALIQCGGDPRQDATIMRGLQWLSIAIDQGELATAWPIGFYFAKLWYHERLYPTIFALSTLGTALSRIKQTQNSSAGSQPTMHTGVRP